MIVYADREGETKEFHYTNYNISETIQLICHIAGYTKTFRNENCDSEKKKGDLSDKPPFFGVDLAVSRSVEYNKCMTP